MEEHNYRAILNNIFRCFHSNPIKHLSELSNPLKLISICYEMNDKSFVFIKDYITNNIYNDKKRDIGDIHIKLVSDLKSKLYKSNIELKSIINLDSLIKNQLESLIHLSQILIVYALVFSKKKFIYIETVQTCFNKIIRKNIYKIINYYTNAQIKKLILEVENDDDLEEEEDDKEDNEEKDLKKYLEEINRDDIIKQNKLKNSQMKLKSISNNLNKRILKINDGYNKTLNIIEQKLEDFSFIGNKNYNSNNLKNQVYVKKKITLKSNQEKDEMINKLKYEYSIIKSNFEQCQIKKEKEIETLKERIKFLNEKVKILEKRKKKFKEYNQLKEKCKKYDELLDKYNKIKNCTMKKWNLTEQEYLQIILKKDDDIENLKDALLKKEEKNEENNDENEDDNFRYINVNYCNHIITNPLKMKIKREFTFSE